MDNLRPVPEDDYFDDEAADFGDPVHPDDRLWRHPSEIRSVPPPGARSIPDTVDFAPVPRRRSVAAVVVASSLVGAAVAVSVIMVTGLGERVVERIVETETTVPVVASPAPTTTVDPEPSDPVPNGMQELAEAASPSLAWITVTNGESSADCAGIVITADGHLLTEARHFEEYTSITVRLHDGSTEEAELVGSDPVTDLAVLRVGRDDLVPADLGDPRALQSGGIVLILAPDGAGKVAASAAMVNAVGAPVRPSSGLPLYDMIQFDLAVPVELSGGPVLDQDGRVVGVSLWGGNGAPYGMAAPIDSARVVADDLITEGRARHAWFGIEGREEQGTPTVVAVVDDSPARAAGIEPGDELVAVDGTPVPSMAAFVTAVRAKRPGDEITVTVRRDGVEDDRVVALGQRD